jgi:hypothetical protein
VAYASYYFASKKVLPTLVDKTALTAMTTGTLEYIEMLEEQAKEENEVFDILLPKYYSETSSGNMLSRGAAFKTCVTKAAAKYYAELIPEFELDVEDLKSTVEHAMDTYANVMFLSKQPIDWHKHSKFAVKTEGDKYCVTNEFLKTFVSIWLGYARCRVSNRSSNEPSAARLAELMAKL